jgi:cyclophilin family peptidyl-prolyl cis-trans isomerase
MVRRIALRLAIGSETHGTLTMITQRETSVSRWNQATDDAVVAREEVQRKQRVLFLYLAVGFVLVVFVGAISFAAGRRNRPPPPPPVAQQPAAAVVEAPQDAPLPSVPDEIRKLLSNPTNPVVRITSGKGDMLVELYEDKVPNTVANLIELADSNFYRGMSFHRIIPGFMAQGGCPNSKKDAIGTPGTGGPGYTFADEFNDTLKHTGRGILSMANAGPNTNGSQFFLCFAAAAHLNGKHAVFGKVVAGQQVMDRLEKIGSQSGRPSEEVRFAIEVVLKQDHPYAVKKL